jgi:hypothetical protein
MLAVLDDHPVFLDPGEYKLTVTLNGVELFAAETGLEHGEPAIGNFQNFKDLIIPFDEQWITMEGPNLLELRLTGVGSGRWIGWRTITISAGDAVVELDAEGNRRYHPTGVAEVHPGRDNSTLIYFDFQTGFLTPTPEQTEFDFNPILQTPGLATQVLTASPGTAAATGTPHCASAWSRLIPDSLARVVDRPGDHDIRIRVAPEANAEILVELPEGEILYVVSGPVCADGLVFWLVEHDDIPGGEGWTAEGDFEEYWLEPSEH